MKKTVIIGNLGQDAQVRQTQQGKQYLAFTVAVSEKSNGQETTTWFSCSGWGERFTTGRLMEFLKKGTKIYIEGNYSPSLYQRQDGSMDISHNLMVNQIELLGSAPQQQYPAQQAAPAAQPMAQTVAQPQPQQFAQPMANPNQAFRGAEPISTSQKIAAQNAGWTPGSGHTDDADIPF